MAYIDFYNPKQRLFVLDFPVWKIFRSAKLFSRLSTDRRKDRNYLPADFIKHLLYYKDFSESGLCFITMFKPSAYKYLKNIQIKQLTKIVKNI